MADNLKKKTFAELMAEFETIVLDMEQGSRPFEECTALFEKGMAIQKELLKRLEEGKQKIAVLDDVSDEPSEPAFMENPDEGA
ncbi:MAG: exodeoxyribonuclease VII small subunit [Clostridia bacterium]|nr:exodeoxyribonuclease VII small subunit [Clostridia bacterium]